MEVHLCCHTYHEAILWKDNHLAIFSIKNLRFSLYFELCYNDLLDVCFLKPVLFSAAQNFPPFHLIFLVHMPYSLILSHFFFYYTQESQTKCAGINEVRVKIGIFHLNFHDRQLHHLEIQYQLNCFFYSIYCWQF